MNGLPHPDEKILFRRLVFMPWRWPRRAFVRLVALSPVWYFLSSGPVLATAFRLRETTDWHAFYVVMWIYFPLFWAVPRAIWDPYISWWVWLFDTVGPG